VRRTCFLIRLEPNAVEEYEARHREIWPELVTAIRDAGIRNYSLFRRGLDVVAYAECEPDGPTAFRRLAETAVDARWSKWMADVIETEVDESGSLLYADEVWHAE
jgi:L-rhamnose mutarotase